MQLWRHCAWLVTQLPLSFGPRRPGPNSHARRLDLVRKFGVNDAAKAAAVAVGGGHVRCEAQLRVAAGAAVMMIGDGQQGGQRVALD